MLVWNHVVQDGLELLATPASAFHLDLMGQRCETHWMPVEVEFYKLPNEHSIPRNLRPKLVV